MLSPFINTQENRHKISVLFVPPETKPKTPEEIAQYYGAGAKENKALPEGHAGRMAIQIVKVGEPAATFSTIEEAEDFYISKAPSQDVDLTDAGGYNYGSCALSVRQNVQVMMGLMINRTANLIAARTRRGAGTHAMMSPKAADILFNTEGGIARVTPHSVEMEEQSCGRWKFAGRLNHSIEIWTSDACADDEVVVAYRGSTTMDGALAVVVEGGFEVFDPLNPCDAFLSKLKLIGADIDPLARFDPII